MQSGRFCIACVLKALVKAFIFPEFLISGLVSFHFLITWYIRESWLWRLSGILLVSWDSLVLPAGFILSLIILFIIVGWCVLVFWLRDL